MNNAPLQAVILAAGESSRFWPLNARHKSLFRIMGKPLIWYTIDGLRKAGVREVIVVQGPKRGIEEELKSLPFCIENVQYVVQQEPEGMADAILCAKNLIKGQFFVLNASRINCEDIAKRMIEKSRQTGTKVVIAGQITAQPWLYGVARVDGDKVLEVVEKPEEGKEPSNIKVPVVRLLDEKIIGYIEKAAGTTNRNDAFEVAISMYAKDHDARIVMVDDGYGGISLKYPWQLFDAQRYVFDRFLTKKTIAKSAQVAKSAVIEGNVFIGENARVMEGAVVKGPCYIGPNCVVGTNSIVRDHCNLESKTVVGALCEAARSIFASDVHIHQGYFGDSIFDSGCRAGAGTITANVRLDRGEIKAKTKKEKDGVKTIEEIATGVKSLGAIVGENTKIGVSVSFMPGVLVGQNCAVGPKMLVKDNLEDGQKYY